MSGALPGPSERTPTYGRHASAPHLGLTRSPYALEDEEDEEEDDNEDDEDDDDEEGDRVLVGSVQDEGEPAEASEAHSHGGFGKKTIGFLAGITLVANNIFGPGLPALPVIFQQAGVLIPTLVFILVAIVSTVGGLMLAEAMRLVPGNDHFRDRIEFGPLARFFLGRVGGLVVQLFLNLSLLAQVLVSIIVSAQVCDLLLVRVAGRTGALEFWPNPGWQWAADLGAGDLPFAKDSYVLSLGVLVVIVIVVPLGYINLDDNIIVQVLSFLTTILIMGVWFVDFGVRFSRGVFLPLALVGSDLTQVLGTVIFNYAGVMTVPSWVNERRRSVSIQATLWTSSLVTTLFMLLVGVLGALAYSVPADSDLLAVINASPEANLVTQMAVYAFPFAGITTSIPVFAIIIRYNLLETGLVGRPAAFFWSVVFPWLIVIPFYTGDGLIELINWSSLVCSGVTNFIVPFVIYLAAMRHKASLTLELRQALDARTLVDEEEEEVAAERAGAAPTCRRRLLACCNSRAPKPLAARARLQRPHFALPRGWSDATRWALAGSMALIMVVLIAGVVVMDILSAFLSPSTWLGGTPPPALPLGPGRRP